MTTPAIRIAPSLLAADSADLKSAVSLLEPHVELFHVDVMDGRFVPNIAMGPDVPRALRKLTDHVLDVHLMVADPERWIDIYRSAGADWISVHAEVSPHLQRTLSQIRESGARAGVALNPATSPEALRYVLEDGDFVVVMSVNPGFGGQTFLPTTLEKIVSVSRLVSELGLANVEIEVDGGVEANNAANCAASGARILVAGSSIYGASRPQEAVLQIYRAAVSGLPDPVSGAARQTTRP